MEDILDSVRRIISRWTSTRIPIVQDVHVGDSTIHVRSTIRLRANDEIMLRTATRGESPLIVDELIDNTSFSVTTPIRFNWTIANNSIVEKTFNQMCIQGIYVGDPVNIPRFPAITVNAISRDSEWLTIDSTKEDYRLQVAVYVEDSTQESGYRFLLQTVKTIQYGLKQNIYPLVGDYDTVALTADAAIGDTFIKVSDTSIFEEYSRLMIEDPFVTEEKRVTNVVDSTTLEIAPSICEPFTVDDNTQVIRVERFIYNSWPSHIDYGKVFRGTMLKAAVIDWFAWEEELQPQPPIDVHLF